MWNTFEPVESNCSNIENIRKSNSLERLVPKSGRFDFHFLVSTVVVRPPISNAKKPWRLFPRFVHQSYKILIVM
jgi:hypothetical protein